RRSALGSAQTLAAKLAASRVQTIVFAPSRTAVELLVRRLRDAIPAKVGGPQPVEGYRGGYLPKERRAIEAGIRDGRVRVVAATNALELGIDIGGLDAAVLLGYPGTLASTWQQAGRAGRTDHTSFSVLVANSTPLNQYVAQHPDYLFETAPEAGFVNPDNLIVRVSHLKCAAFELAVEREEDFGPGTNQLLDILAEENVLHPVNGRYHWAAEAYPAEDVSLRTAAVDNFVIVEEGPKPRVIGEVDRPSAPLLIHDEAIYMHCGRQYHVDRLDWTERTAFVRPVEVDYYTDANLAVDLKVLETHSSSEGPSSERNVGEVAVTFLATIFKKIKLDTLENVGWGKICLPQEDMHTASYWLALREEAWRGMEPARMQAGLWGVAHLLTGVAPLFLMCDPRDLQCAVQVRSPFTEAPTVFIYERNPGGVGLSEALYAGHERLVAAALDLGRACPCDDGCPACVGPAIGEGPDSKRAALELLDRLVADGTA
ncbi:MAG TPA: Zn-binding domain-containing protein, partial [Dehalococcoidia bacterium]|nr:Zn-binding domain-containing protein [Dehalococcoidia bacterium]